MRLTSVLRVAVAVALLGATGCNSNNKGKIEGTRWTSQAGVVKGLNVPAGLLELDFRATGGLVYRAGPKTMTGTYSLGWGDTVTLKLDEPLAGRKNHAEKVVVNGDYLTMTDTDGTTMTFERVR